MSDSGHQIRRMDDQEPRFAPCAALDQEEKSMDVRPSNFEMRARRVPRVPVNEDKTLLLSGPSHS